jgi:hypothetical protein
MLSDIYTQNMGQWYFQFYTVHELKMKDSANTSKDQFKDFIKFLQK